MFFTTGNSKTDIKCNYQKYNLVHQYKSSKIKICTLSGHITAFYCRTASYCDLWEISRVSSHADED